VDLPPITGRLLLQMAGDAVCLAHVLRSLDEYTIVVMRGSEEHAEEDLQLVARALTRRSSVNATSRLGAAAGGKEAQVAGQHDDIMAAVLHSVLHMQVRLHVRVVVARL
jgi:hypothetical protein